MVALDTAATRTIPDPPRVKGLPFVGNALEFAKDPAKFFVDCYRKYGPAFKVSMFGNSYTVIAGVEAANFMGTREGKECLRSKEFWQGLVDEYGASKTLNGTDGELHNELRAIMKRGYSRESVRGRYNELVEITDGSITRDWKPGEFTPVVQAMQYMVTDQLGTMLTGQAPLEYVKDIRTTILYILNVLVTRVRPKILLMDPRYKQAKARMFELGEKMIAQYNATKDKREEMGKNLVDDVMEAHEKRPDLIPRSDLIMSLTGPYVAGLDTVANTIASFVYAVLKDPVVLKRVQDEADALYAKGSIDEPDLINLPVINGAIQESMRLYPIAVAQMRAATKDFEFGGHLVREGELIFVATAVPHFMEEYYPDPYKFDIDRYERPRAEHMKPGVYSPYGRGPHICLGKTLAEVQMALAMSRLFYKCNLELESPDYVLKRKAAPTPGPVMDFKVKVVSYRH